jgi:hypothetical protein
MRTLFVIAVGLLLAGCSAGVPPENDPPATPPAIADTSVLVADAELLIGATLKHYIEVTNQIMSGDTPVSAINDLTTPEWAIEESNGFAALTALGPTAATVSMSRWQLTAMRGRHTMVDALVSACLGSATTQFHVTVRLIPRNGALVIDEISPWEDSTWCTVSSSL